MKVKSSFWALIFSFSIFCFSPTALSSCGTFNGQLICPDSSSTNVIGSDEKKIKKNRTYRPYRQTSKKNKDNKTVKKSSRCFDTEREIRRYNQKLNKKYSIQQGERYRNKLRQLKKDRENYC